MHQGVTGRTDGRTGCMGTRAYADIYRHALHLTQPPHTVNKSLADCRTGSPTTPSQHHATPKAKAPLVLASVVYITMLYMYVLYVHTYVIISMFVCLHSTLPGCALFCQRSSE